MVLVLDVLPLPRDNFEDGIVQLRAVEDMRRVSLASETRRACRNSRSENVNL